MYVCMQTSKYVCIFLSNYIAPRKNLTTVQRGAFEIPNNVNNFDGVCSLVICKLVAIFAFEKAKSWWPEAVRIEPVGRIFETSDSNLIQGNTESAEGPLLPGKQGSEEIPQSEN